MKRSPRKLLLVVLAGVLVVAVVGWLVAGRLRSPADEAASRRPPKPSSITVAVEKAELVSTVTANASIEYGSPVPVALAGVVGDNGLASTSIGDGGSSQRVTRAPKVGRIREGGVLLEVNGRPVFVLRGKVPMHRTLLPGVEGDDVKQLQRALNRLGNKVKVSGTFDAATASAVTAFYKKRGYQAQLPSRAVKTELKGLREAVNNARLAVVEQKKELAKSAVVRLAKAKVADARIELAKAEEDLAKLRSPELTPDEEAAIESAEKAVRDAREAVTKAQEDLDAAKKAASSVPTPDPSATPSTQPQPTPTQNLAPLERAVARAREDLGAAERAYERARQKLMDEREKLVGEKEKAVRTAKNALLEAKEALRKELDQAAGKIKLENANTSLASSREALADFLKSYGTSVPPGEVVFLPSLPARVSKSEIKAGATVEKDVALVTSSQVVAYGFVDIAEADLLKVGLKASIETEGGTTVKAMLTAFGDKAKLPGSGQQDGQNQEQQGQEQQEATTVPILVTPDSLKGLKRFAGGSVTVKLHVGATDGAVLAVPIAAVVTGADGKARVQLQTAPGKTREVEVTTGLSADGLVEVSGGDLKEGDLVVVPSV
ncbi:peptidoglycan-binding protein [Nonomuraea sp. NPDC050556]|uniref:peptidoglycan-binding protein n=1 Tax=Nonomuraea sp. NPDC050556 TaxID=3364369 RepID=UPI00378B21FD